MGDILSQSEIDELLKALNTGEIDVQQMQDKDQQKKIKVYDFSRANKFAKDHIKTLHIINDTYARLITNFLSGYLRNLVQVDVLEVQPMSYYDFSNSIANPAILAIIDFNPLAGSIIFEMDPNISFALVDRILGGKGSSLEKVRGFTEIELAIIERIIIQMLNLMREPWENVLELRPRLEKIETNAQFAQIISPNETVALITLRTKVGEEDGFINICIPYIVVEPIVSKLSTRYWFSNIEKTSTKETKEDIENKIQNVKVPVRAVLGSTSLSLGDIIELQAGDVIPLETSVNGELKVMVGDLEKFKAIPGVRKNKVAIKITSIVETEVE
ncbi:flagellar motor switch protein FliM [Clostridium thermosuccinogenes]|uniref:Flagellar motor switch protein FliM n=1 Tax=Clostridium thermosuccinogenes TaxID=84032 RepID=A0A2K2F2H7_9CLOT|nr:flagellar motor switch protein FliM [Pseudoclostridium thermosuccinogenes]AUS96335.1 flagellar motor switch protein FliM [Pseudoclostridium thermosuccinogenes]PNT92991.1 flagellar motor switch protein FliM [Pseudoclostridium thermosuccinogenes]PNT98549.1 flagellar motor switch protein FliM [Pseudoclostridium thermosuccinogenes]PNU00651.1 flagellar motor switch protein FliM [Pseudoclostridium thermosuccinogenes]